MYGYIVPNKSTLRASDFVLYRSYYCGICCETGRTYGQLPRFTTNYDFAFLSALLIDYSTAEAVIEEQTCVLNPFKKKAVLQHSLLLARLAAANIMLAYQKASDGVVDGDGVKYGVVRKALEKPCSVARNKFPHLWAAVKNTYRLQREAEEKNVASIDRAADPFASLMRDMPALLLDGKSDESIRGLCYNIGKFVYLADALDDIVDDCKHRRYNPFAAVYGEAKNRAAFIAEHRDDLQFAFDVCCNRAAKYLSELKLTQSYSLIRNVVCDGMRSKTAELMNSVKKLPSPRI